MADDRKTNEKSAATSIQVVGVTNFQLLPDNGGYTILFGSRRLELGDDEFNGFPTSKVDAVAALFVATPLLKDLHRVFGKAIDDYEKKWGKVVVPGVDTPNG